MAECLKKERILLIVPMLDQGGLERICALTAQLLKIKYEVHLIVFNTEGMIYDVSGVDLIDLHMGAVSGKIGKLLNVCKRIKKVRQIKRALDIQISYSFGQTANIVNVSSKCCDMVWTGIRGYGALSDHRRMKFVCKYSDRVISCTKVMEQEIAVAYPVKTSEVFYNPCNLAQIEELTKEPIDPKFDYFFARQGKIIISMGRAHDVKGFWHLIKCVYLAKKQFGSIKLMIIGDGDYSEYVKLASKLHMEKDVLFTGVQKNPFALLAKADIYALTSESEGFPNALVEAMACGLACISVNCKTGPAEILHEDYKMCSNQDIMYFADYGILTPVFHGEKNLEADSFTAEEEEFAKGICRLLADEELFESYKKKALARSKNFGVETYVQQIERLITQDIILATENTDHSV